MKGLEIKIEREEKRIIKLEERPVEITHPEQREEMAKKRLGIL